MFSEQFRRISKRSSHFQKQSNNNADPKAAAGNLTSLFSVTGKLAAQINGMQPKLQPSCFGRKKTQITSAPAIISLKYDKLYLLLLCHAISDLKCLHKRLSCLQD